MNQILGWKSKDSFFSGCVDENGAVREVDEVWQHPTNSCLVLECTTGGIVEKWIHCPTPPPKPSPQCVLIMGDECCPSWLCTWVLVRLFVYYELLCKISPYHDCSLLLWSTGRTFLSCRECVDHQGNPRSLDETWEDLTNPCTVMVCRRHGPRRMLKKLCPPLSTQPPTHKHCRLTEVDCCPTWNCS